LYGRLRVAVRTRWGELLPLLPVEGRKDDREGRPKARRVGLNVTPLERRGRGLGRWVVFIVLVLAFGWRDTEHTIWRGENCAIGRLSRRIVRNGCIAENCVGWNL
jgi:hypothetical protein